MYSIIIVGCGATGSNVTALLSQYAISEKKVKEIILVDGDQVEVKNFRNQKFTERDVDKNKARVLATRYSKLGIDVSYVDTYIGSKDELVSLMKGKDNIILVGCVDNNIARKHMHEAFYAKEIPSVIYIDTGNGDGDNRVGQTVCGAKQGNKVVKPPVGDIYPQIFVEEPIIEKKVTYSCSQIEEHPQNFVINVMSATVTFTMINNIISLNKLKNPIIRFNADVLTVGK